MPSQAVIDYYRKLGVAPRVADAIVASAAQMLAEQRRRIAAQPKVRIVRGGHRGELARITGAGKAGGFAVMTENGVALALAERDFVRLGA